MSVTCTGGDVSRSWVSESCFLWRGLAGKVHVGLVAILLPFKARLSREKRESKGQLWRCHAWYTSALEDQS